jgi:hypothetical protein
LMAKGRTEPLVFHCQFLDHNRVELTGEMGRHQILERVSPGDDPQTPAPEGH